MAGPVRRPTVVVAILAASTLPILSVGCTSGIPVMPEPTTPTSTISATASGSASATPTASRPLEPSQDSLEYADSLGGTSHEGEDLYLVVGGRYTSEKDAQAALNDALALFGDMQAYFIVQASDNFDGLAPGSWVVIEAYHDQPTEDNLQFDRRGFPKATIAQVSVTTDDPIPVVEDLVGG